MNWGKKSRLFKLSCMTALISLLLAAGCANTSQDYEPVSDSTYQDEADKLNVVTTIYPLYEFAQAVGKDKADVFMLLPPGADAHTYELKPSDIVRISKADVFIYVGAGMEPWAHDILAGIMNKDLLILDSSSKVALIRSQDFHEHHHSDNHIGHHDEIHSAHDHEEVDQGDYNSYEEHHSHEEHNADEDNHRHEEHYSHEEHNADEDNHRHEEHNHGEFDPHFWLDFEMNQVLVYAVAEAFSEKDSLNAEFYHMNAVEYNAALDKLHKEYIRALSDCRHREFVTGGHNAFSYLAHKYGLKPVSAFGISPDSEPTPKRIKEIIDLTKEQGIRYIYFEELVNPKLAETIAREAGAETLCLNPAHTLLKERFDKKVSFISIMEENLENLIIGLECQD